IDVEQGHAFLNQTLRPSQANAALIGEQFAYGPNATAAEMIDIVQSTFAAPQINEVFDRGDEIFIGQDALGQINIDSKLLIKLVAADATKVVFFWIEK